jgi:hypothetical protein
MENKTKHRLCISILYVTGIIFRKHRNELMLIRQTAVLLHERGDHSILFCLYLCWVIATTHWHQCLCIDGVLIFYEVQNTLALLVFWSLTSHR